LNTDNQSHRESMSTLVDRLLTLPQYLIPQHFLSVAMHALTRSKVTWFKNAFIKFICWKFKVNLDEAASQQLSDYVSFNAFFTRQLKKGVHQIDSEHMIVSPVDGAISQIGTISQGYVVQAKGRSYSVNELVGNDEALAAQFSGGQFATIYLSPRDYHRIHMPLSGKLQAMRYIPGKLFSVNPRTARTVPRLFARNERVVTVYETEYGPVALVLVGAIFVGSMETVWAGQITPPYGKEVQDWQYDGSSALEFAKGEEMGRFNMGSTVVMLLPPKAPQWLASLCPEQVIRLGQAMAK
jgi:phosphatidylserine decarboxylase